MSYNSLTGLGSHAGEANTWFRMQDNAASTQVTDSSGNGNHGTLQGGRTTADLSVTGDAWSTLALEPNGTTDYVDLAASTTAAYDGAAFTQVIRFKNPAVAADITFAGKSGTSASSVFADNSGQRLRFKQGGSNRNAGPTNRGMVLDAWDGWIASWTKGSPVDFLLQDGTSGSGGATNLFTFDPNRFWFAGVTYSTRPIREFILIPRATTAEEREALMAGPEPLFTGTALSVNQTATKCEIAGTISWDAQGNGTASTLYQWQVADDAFGTNTQDRGRAATWYPEPGDGSKFVRVSVSAANPSGNIDDAETQTTAWVAITAAGVPSTEGKAAIAHNALPVAAGSADFTSPGFGTAAGAIVLMSHSDSSSTIISDYRMSAGYYDFTNSVQGVGSTRADDGLSSGDYGWRANLANQFTWQPVTGQRYTISQITDGVRLTWVAGTEPMECTVILLDENVLVESGSLLATDDVFQPTIDLPFKGTAAFNMHSCVNSTGTAVTGTLTFGAIDRSGETMWWLGGCARNSYPTSIYGGQGNNGYWARQYNGGASWSLEADWSTDFYSLELTTTGSPLTDLVPYICLGNITVEVQNRVDQGVTGIQTIPLSLASNPQVAMFFNTLLQSGTGETTGDEAGFFGIGVDDGTTARSYGYLQERNVSTTNMESTWENDASQSVWVYVGGTGLQSRKAKVDSMNASSIDMDYTTGTGTVRRFGLIVFGEEAAPPSGNWRPFENPRFRNEQFRDGVF